VLKIYGRANSINVRKVLWAADEIGLAYEREDWGRGFRPLTEEPFASLNPLRAIPVVDDAGVVVRESHVIVRYLADKHGRTDLLPNEPQRRADVEAWMDWAATDFYWGVRPVFWNVAVTPGKVAPAMVEAGAKEWALRTGLLEAHLAKGHPYVAGTTFTVADIPIGLILNRWYALSFDKPAFPAVHAYFERLKTRPAFRTHGANGLP
jgi:glutathione S-transferase